MRDQIGLTDHIELEIQGDHLIVRSSVAPRATWATQFQQMAQAGDDALIDPEQPATLWDVTEWEWK